MRTLEIYQHFSAFEGLKQLGSVFFGNKSVFLSMNKANLFISLLFLTDLPQMLRNIHLFYL